ncbi:hypothetical protein HK096_003266, partial [Nowakowskiella sp. JEL0078]
MNQSPSTRRKYLRESFPASDIDIFIWGLDEENTKMKMDQIFQTVIDNVPFQFVAVRTPSAVTIVSQFPYRHIQLVLRLYRSPAEILMGFDVDSCCVGFDGKELWVSKRALMSITSQVNIIDLSRRSPSYEMRLAKYSERGFEVRVPTLDRNRIDPQRARKLRPEHELAGSYARNNYVRDGDLRSIAVDSHDYQSVFLPYGEKWTAKRITFHAFKKDKILNNPFLMHRFRKTKHHQHPCFYGTMKEIFGDCCKQCPPLPNDWDPEEDRIFVKGNISFIVDDPGRQQIGSFNPTTDGDWSSEAYIHELSDDVVKAISDDDVEKLKQLIKTTSDEDDASKIGANKRDWLGRTPLHLAMFFNAVQCVKFLISPEVDAKLSLTLSDGRNPLHIAAEYGLTEIARLILNRNKEKISEKERKLAEAAEAIDSKKSLRKKLKNEKQVVEKENEDVEEADENEDIENDYDSVSQDDLSEEEDYHSVSENDLKDEKKEPNEEVMTEDDILDIDWTDWDFKMSPLHFACFHGQHELVKLLLDFGASKTKSMISQVTYSIFHLAILCIHHDKGLLNGIPIFLVDMRSETIFHCAVDLNRIDIIQKLVPMCEAQSVMPFDLLDSFGASPLYHACRLGRTKIVKILLDAGAKVTPTSNIIKASKNNQNSTKYKSFFGQQQTTTEIIYKSRSPFQAALMSGNHQCLKMLLESVTNNPSLIGEIDFKIIDFQTIRTGYSNLNNLYFKTNDKNIADIYELSNTEDLIKILKENVVTLAGFLSDLLVTQILKKENEVKAIINANPNLNLPASYSSKFVSQSKIKKESPVKKWWQVNGENVADTWEKYINRRLLDEEKIAENLANENDFDFTIDDESVAEVLRYSVEQLDDQTFCDEHAIEALVGRPHQWHSSTNNGEFG